MVVFMGYKERLLNKMTLSKQNLDKEKIISAFEFAEESHIGQYRKSGDEYILHPFEVAKILIELNMDTDTIVAGLLHDVVEDTLITSADIKYHFGNTVGELVDGVTKLSYIPEGTKKQQENIRKMIVAMAKDVRVVIIKLADRVHNMRTLKFMKPEKQISIATETLEIFAPLAHRLGMAKIKWELEDLCFYYLQPETYKEIVRLVDTKRREREKYTDDVIEIMKNELKAYNFESEVSGRPKHLYSIYKKMKSGKEFDELYDLIAVRVIVKEESECYMVLGLVHNHWKPVPGRFKDYIAVPKANGYQSIHTTVVGPEGRFVEIQIRTDEMHRIAEEGVAAHWSYKEKNKYNRRDNVYSWLRQILEWQQMADSSEEFIKTVTGDILNETVFVFSPQGDVIEMLKGATPLDFAFHIHTQIGYKCIGAKVNGRIVPLEYKLQNGDQVEIITSKAVVKGPGKDWLNIVVTQGAKSKIKKWIKDQQFEEKIKEGKQILEKELDKFDVGIKEIEEIEFTKEYLKKQRMPNFQEFLFNIGIGRLRVDTFVERYIEKERKEEPKLDINNMISENQKKSKISGNQQGIVIDGTDNTLIRFAKCCTPLPGDSVFGYVTRGSGIAIHKSDCRNFISLKEKEESRVLEVKWDESLVDKKVNKYGYNFTLTMVDRPNALMDVVRIISDSKINILGVNSNSHNENGDKVATMKLSVEISNKEQVSRLKTSLYKLEGIIRIK